MLGGFLSEADVLLPLVGAVQQCLEAILSDAGYLATVTHIPLPPVVANVSPENPDPRRENFFCYRVVVEKGPEGDGPGGAEEQSLSSSSSGGFFPSFIAKAAEALGIK